MAAHLQTGQTYGEQRRPWHAGGIRLSEVSHRDRRDLPRHSHQAGYISMLLAGSYRERFGSRTLEYATFGAGLHPEGFTHQDSLGDGGGRLFMVEIEPQWMLRLARQAPLLHLEPSLLEAEAALIIRRLHVRYLRDPALSVLLAESDLLELLGAATRAREYREASRPAWLESIRERLHGEFDRPLTVLGLAEGAGIHPVHLARTFRRRFGCTLGEYLNRVRLERASLWLATSDAAIASVALEAGFADQSHLTRVFKKALDTTPAAYRALARGR